MAYWGRNLLWSFRPPFLQDGSIDLSFDARVLGFTLLISLLTGLVFGIIPAIKASGTDINEILKTGGRGGALGWTHNRLRSLLVIWEISIALVALVGSGLFLRSMLNAQQYNPGFESQNLLQINFDLLCVTTPIMGNSSSVTSSSAPSPFPAWWMPLCRRTAW